MCLACELVNWCEVFMLLKQTEENRPSPAHSAYSAHPSASTLLYSTFFKPQFLEHKEMHRIEAIKEAHVGFLKS